MQININKTEVTQVNNNRREAIQLQGKEIKEADSDSFTYLGSVVSKGGGTDEDIRNRINKARHVFNTHDPFGEQLPSLYKTKLKFSVQM